MRSLFVSLFLLSAWACFAQSSYNKFQWQAKPVMHTIDKKFENDGAVYVADERTNEYAIEKEGFFLYRTVHKIVHINNDQGIEGFNKIYLPFNEGIEMMDVKARTILPNGRIIEMDRKNIKDLKDDDGEYKIFALEGLTKGCEIEYYFTLKKNPSFFGREILSGGIPSQKIHFELITPDHLIFETMSYNGLPQSKDTVHGEKRYLVIDDGQVDASEDEAYSMTQASLKRVEYKLSYNTGKNAHEKLFTWNELAKKAFQIYTEVSDKDSKKIKGLLSDIGATEGTEVQKIVAIENYMKKNYITREDVPDEDADDLGKVIKNKVSSQKAIARIYAGLFSAAGVNFQIVLCGDREDYVIDRNFENWNNARNFLFYFPSTQKFLAPTEMGYRYPWIPPTWGETNGLFCVGTTIGNFTTAVAQIKNIKMEDVSKSFVNMDISMKMEKDDALAIDIKQIYGGYAAPNYKLPFVFLPADQQDKVLKEMIKFGTNSENIISHSFENREMEQADPYKPFVIKASVKSTNMIERAGEKLLLKIGEMIGQQAEMYETKERKTDIDLPYSHSLVRHIEFILPEGYQAKNLAELKTDLVYKDSDEVLFGFSSSYELKGRILNITIEESYNRVHYTKKDYENFKKVINAAADFNKIVLILDKV